MRFCIPAALVALGGCSGVRGGSRGCMKDGDCKGSRICEAGACVEPKAVRDAAASPAPRVEPRSTEAGSRWMLGGGARHLGQAPGPAPLETPKLLWSFATGGPVSTAPLVGPDGMLFVGSHDGFLYALTSAGEQKWRFQTGDRIWTTPALSSTGALYFGSDDDHLYAVDAAAGTLKWKLKLGSCDAKSGKGPQAVLCDVDGGPTLGPDGTIYVGGDALYAVTPEGKVRSRFATGGHVSSPPALSVDGKTLVFGCQDSSIYAIDAETFTQRFMIRAEDQVEPAPVIAEDGTIYVGSDDHKLYAISPAGEVLWSVVTRGDIRRAAAVAPDGSLYVGSHDRNVYALTSQGVARWYFSTGGKVHASPTVATNGIVLIASEDDRVYAVDSAGALKWFLEIGDDVDAQPWLTPDGTLLIASDTGKIEAFR